MSSCFSNVIADAAKNAASNTATNLDQRLYERAQRVIPGGVNSPVRAFRAVGGTPRFVQRAQGAYFWDANGSRYIDYIGSCGPMILRHGLLPGMQKKSSNGKWRELQKKSGQCIMGKTDYGSSASTGRFRKK